MAHVRELPALSNRKDKPCEPIGQLVERHTVGVERNITGLTALRDDVADAGVTQGAWIGGYPIVESMARPEIG